MTVSVTTKKVGKKAVEAKESAPVTRSEAMALLRLLGDLQRELMGIAADGDTRIVAIQEEITKAAQPLRERVDTIVDNLYVYFEANRDELTENGARQSVDLGTGTIGEHKNPFKVDLTKKDLVLAALKKLGLTKFIRIAEDVDKEAMLSTKETRELAAGVKGVKVTQDIEFRVRPNADLAEMVVDTKRLKKRIGA